LQRDSTVPKSQNKHQQRTEATRRKLLNAARRIFAKDGFEASRIESVASEAGYTRGAFYAQFKSKEDLFFALLEEQVTLHLDELRLELEQCATNREKVQCLRRFYVSRVTDRQWTILMLEFKLYALRHPRLRAKLAKAHRVIRDKMKFETIAPLLPREFTCDEKRNYLVRTVLEGVLRGIALEYAYDPTDLPEDEVSATLGQIFDVVVRPESVA
jgi:AcrR family transcriptional regulator